MEDEILTVKEAAKYLKVGENIVRGLITDKKLKASKIGKLFRIKKSDIDKFLEDNSNIK